MNTHPITVRQAVDSAAFIAWQSAIINGRTEWDETDCAIFTQIFCELMKRVESVTGSHSN